MKPQITTRVATTALAVALTASMSMAQTPATPKPTQFPVGAPPKVKVGQTYTAETYDSWEMLCVKTEKGPEPCEIGQLVLDAKSNPISDIRVFPLQPGSQVIAGATMVIPLGVQLSDGLIFGVDKKKGKQYPYAFCNNIGCIARIGFTAIELQNMRTGKEGKLQFTMANNPQNPIVLAFSLKGFAKAYAALNKKIIADRKSLKKKKKK